MHTAGLPTWNAHPSSLPLDTLLLLHKQLPGHLARRMAVSDQERLAEFLSPSGGAWARQALGFGAGRVHVLSGVSLLTSSPPNSDVTSLVKLFPGSQAVRLGAPTLCAFPSVTLHTLYCSSLLGPPLILVSFSSLIYPVSLNENDLGTASFPLPLSCQQIVTAGFGLERAVKVGDPADPVLHAGGPHSLGFLPSSHTTSINSGKSLR